MRSKYLDSSIKGKLVTILFAGNVSVLLVMGFVAASYLFLVLKEHESHDLDRVGDYLALQVGQCLAAGCSPQAELSRLASRQLLVLAELASPHGVLACYRSPRTTAFPGQMLGRLAPDLATLRRVPLPGGGSGTLKIRAPGPSLVSPLLFCGALLFAALLGIATVVRILSFRFNRLVADPIAHLTQKMEIVSQSQDYQVRVDRWSDDEIGRLFDCFNHMLAEISVRDDRLALHREELEVEVADRTYELSRVNDQLGQSLGEVRKAMQTAQASSQAKSEFLAQMSHEIRTPMYGVLGMTELLLNTELTKEQARYVDTVRHSGEALLSIINSILDFSKIEAGRLELEIIPFNLHETVNEVLELLAEDAEKKGLSFTSQIAPEVPCSLKGDPVRLRQVMVNLLSNAIKFTHSGGVHLDLALESEPAVVRFTVKDTGVGIEEKAIGKIFQQFSQADQSITRRYGGTGLGLAIARQLTELMGGEISVESEEGKGSTFSFTVSLEIPDQEAPAPTPRVFSALRGKRVLIVDAGFSSSHILLRYVNAWGMEAEGAVTAREALRKLSLAPFDLALVDEVLPEGDGVEVARALCGHPAGRSLAVVLFTQSEEDFAREGGGVLAGCLKKPVRQGHLYEALVQALGMEPGEGDALATLKTAKGRIPLILLVEDNEVNQEVGRGMLESFGCRVDIVGNGLEALTAFSQTEYDLIFMDTQMPEMDGLEATRRIRQWEGVKDAGVAVPDLDGVGRIPCRGLDPAASGGRPSIPGSHVPIVSLTAYAMKEDREACLAAGADDHLSKPFSREMLAQVLRKQLQGEGSPQGALAAAADGGAGHDEIPQALAMIQSISGTKGLEILRKVVELYLTSTPTLLQTLREAESGGDAMMLKAAAHSFKSSSANLGAVKLAGVCHELEALGRSGSTEGALPLLQRVEEEYRTVRSALMGGGV